MSQPRRPARLVSMPAWAAWTATIVLVAIGLAGAAISVFVGDMYGHDVAGDIRTDQVPSLAAAYIAAGAFVAIPVYVVGLYRRSTELQLLSLGVFVLILATLLLAWWLL